MWAVRGLREVSQQVHNHLRNVLHFCVKGREDFFMLACACREKSGRIQRAVWGGGQDEEETATEMLFFERLECAVYQSSVFKVANGEGRRGMFSSIPQRQAQRWPPMAHCPAVLRLAPCQCVLS